MKFLFDLHPPNLNLFKSDVSRVYIIQSWPFDNVEASPLSTHHQQWTVRIGPSWPRLPDGLKWWNFCLAAWKENSLRYFFLLSFFSIIILLLFFLLPLFWHSVSSAVMISRSHSRAPLWSRVFLLNQHRHNTLVISLSHRFVTCIWYLFHSFFILFSQILHLTQWLETRSYFTGASGRRRVSNQYVTRTRPYKHDSNRASCTCLVAASRDEPSPLQINDYSNDSKQ